MSRLAAFLAGYWFARLVDVAVTIAGAVALLADELELDVDANGAGDG